MTYTDEQLKRTLAKMLPEKIAIHAYNTNGTEQGMVRDLMWLDDDGDFGIEVLDTELLHLCWLVEETLEPAQCSQYAEVLANKLEIVDDGWYGDWSINWHEVATIAHATWQQRTTALAKTKGIEIV